MIYIVYIVCLAAGYLVGREVGQSAGQSQLKAMEKEKDWWRDIANRKQNPLPPWPPGGQPKEQPWQKTKELPS